MPRMAAMRSGRIGPSSQSGMKWGITRSPTATPSTSAPRATTWPAPSATGTIGSAAPGKAPVATATSM
jgi:hypothetical protein